MQQEEFSVYTSYPYPQYYPTSASVSVLDNDPATRTTGEHIAFQPPTYPPEPVAGPPTPPRKRPGRSGAILLLTIILTLIFGVGLFSGWQFSNNRSSSTTTSTAAATTTSTSISSSNTSLEAAQEAAIAKIEPAVVELKVTTAQGEQIGSGVIIDTKGDIVTNNHVVNGELTIVAILSNGSTQQAQLVGTAVSYTHLT